MKEEIISAIIAILYFLTPYNEILVSKNTNVIIFVLAFVLATFSFFFLLKDNANSKSNPLDDIVVQKTLSLDHKNSIATGDRSETLPSTGFGSLAKKNDVRFHEFSGKEIMATAALPAYGSDIAEHYLLQKRLAESGSGGAAFQLYRLHTMCPEREIENGDAVAAKIKSREFLLTYLEAGHVYQTGFESYVTQEEACIDMWMVAEVPEVSWLEIAQESDYPLMVKKNAARLSIEEYERNFSKYTGASLVGGDLNAIRETRKFYKNKLPGDPLVTVWDYLLCSNHTNCDGNQYAEFIKHSKHEYEAELILNEAEKIANLIETGEIRDFEFVYQLDPAAPAIDPETIFD